MQKANETPPGVGEEFAWLCAKSETQKSLLNPKVTCYVSLERETTPRANNWPTSVEPSPMMNP